MTPNQDPGTYVMEMGRSPDIINVISGPWAVEWEQNRVNLFHLDEDADDYGGSIATHNGTINGARRALRRGLKKPAVQAWIAEKAETSGEPPIEALERLLMEKANELQWPEF